MPIYEYRCLACKRRISVFVRSVNSSTRATCEHCGSAKLSRLMSKFAVHGGRGDSDSMPGMGMPGMDDVDENDPRSVARWARRMGDQMGEDLGPEFDDMVNRMEAGESPDDVMGDDGFDGADDDF